MAVEKTFLLNLAICVTMLRCMLSKKRAEKNNKNKWERSADSSNDTDSSAK